MIHIPHLLYTVFKERWCFSIGICPPVVRRSLIGHFFHGMLVWPLVWGKWSLTCRMLCAYSIGAPIGAGQRSRQNHYCSLKSFHPETHFLVRTAEKFWNIKKLQYSRVLKYVYLHFCIREQEGKFKRSREQREMKKEQGKLVKGASAEKWKGAGRTG